MENKRDIHTERLEKLKQATILNYTDRINYDSKTDLYYTMLNSLINGELDDVFLSNNVSVKDKDIFQLVQKYMSLCFYEGDISYWTESVDGIYSTEDLESVVKKILDNYDFLLRLAKETSEASLKELVEFHKTDTFRDEVIIDLLRGRFRNDERLIETIDFMSDENGPYKDFTIEQKALLCSQPEGVIYKKNSNGDKETIPASELLSEIKIGLLGEDSPSFHLGDALKHMNIEDFKEIIYNIYIDDYKKDSAIKK